MNFGVDDPLGDILSDDNDSFFDEPKLVKRGSISKTPEKKSMVDIFKISDKDSTKRSDDWLGLDGGKIDERPKSTKRIIFDDDDDILGVKKDHGDAKSKKHDLLESILGSTKVEEKKKITFDDVFKESMAKKIEPQPALFSGETPREGRRGRRSSGGMSDPLGLFSNEPKSLDVEVKAKPAETEKKDEKMVEDGQAKPGQTKSTPNISHSMPDWLGGSPIKPNKSEEVIMTQPKQDEAEIQLKQNDESFSNLLTHQKLSQTHLDYQNTSLALQQQESQLMMAIQFKKYEENMAEIQQKQQDILLKQEQQFNSLLERQIAKQQIMESNMRLQQERINNHIQMLISQPPITMRFTKNDGVQEAKESGSEETSKTYESLINSMKQRQHEETFLLEESYKKQISLLEQSLESMESRLKTDLTKLMDDFEQRMQENNLQHESEIGKYKEKLRESDLQHGEEIKQIRESQSRMMEEMKYEQSALIENIKEAKRSEMSILSESNLYVQKLDSNIEVLYSNSKALQEIKDNIERDSGILTRAREESLRSKEHEVVLMKTTLEKCRQAAEEERTQLLTLIRSLETKIAEQNHSAKEERWALHQAASTLAARTAALDREMEFNRNSIEREREQLKTMKEQILAEQEKMILQLTEEKLALSVEKTKIETSSKLNQNFDVQRAQADLDAAIQVAKEAAESTDRDRQQLHRQQIEVERLKRSLVDQERRLVLKERELDDMMISAERKACEGENAMQSSKNLERQFNERLKVLQTQLTSLASREKKLAEEKINLSKERVDLHTTFKQMKKCGLCAVDAPKITNYEELPLHFPIPISELDVDQDIISFHLEEDEHNVELNELY